MKTQAAPSCPPPSHPGSLRTTLRTPGVRPDHPRTAVTAGAAILACHEDPTKTALGVPERVTKDGGKARQGPNSAHHPINLGVNGLSLRGPKGRVKRKHSPSYYPSQSGATLSGRARSSQAPMQAPPRLVSRRLSRGLRPRGRPGRLQYGGDGRGEPGVLAE